jgi:hypothetical protein
VIGVAGKWQKHWAIFQEMGETASDFRQARPRWQLR